MLPPVGLTLWNLLDLAGRIARGVFLFVVGEYGLYALLILAVSAFLWLLYRYAVKTKEVR